MTQKIGIIGGSGLYKLNAFQEIQMGPEFFESQSNAYGRPSGVIRKCVLEGFDVELYFLPRHGVNHHLNPSEVPYRANILALKELGVDWIISISAVGSLKEDIAPGDMVIIDQYIDRTKNRPSTFFHNGIVAHVGFGDPVCSVLRRYLLDGANEVTDKVHDGGTYICMEGPAFSTRAESEMYRSWGASVIGMTNLPEAKLAREAEISYATLAMSTDYDCWHTDHDDVTVEQVVAIMNQNVQTAQDILLKVIPRIAAHEGLSPLNGTLKSAIITKKENFPPKRRYDLNSIIGKYL
jgi:5'-methylthioadenosine phosphorylase